MGLLDGILGNVVGAALGGQPTQQAGQDPLSSVLAGLGGNQAQSSALLAMAMSMLQQHGGLGGVLGMFRQSGMAQHADSWVGAGSNMAISGDQLSQVFGDSSISNIAAQLGMSGSQASSAMAQLLPEIVNQLTPSGQVPENSSDLITQALTMLRRESV